MLMSRLVHQLLFPTAPFSNVQVQFSRSRHPPSLQSSAFFFSDINLASPKFSVSILRQIEFSQLQNLHSIHSGQFSVISWSFLLSSDILFIEIKLSVVLQFFSFQIDLNLDLHRRTLCIDLQNILTSEEKQQRQPFQSSFIFSFKSLLWQNRLFPAHLAWFRLFSVFVHHLTFPSNRLSGPLLCSHRSRSYIHFPAHSSQYFKHPLLYSLAFSSESLNFSP